METVQKHRRNLAGRKHIPLTWVYSAFIIWITQDIRNRTYTTTHEHLTTTYSDTFYPRQRHMCACILTACSEDKFVLPSIDASSRDGRVGRGAHADKPFGLSCVWGKRFRDGFVLVVVWFWDPYIGNFPPKNSLFFCKMEHFFLIFYVWLATGTIPQVLWIICIVM